MNIETGFAIIEFAPQSDFCKCLSKSDPNVFLFELQPFFLKTTEFLLGWEDMRNVFLFLLLVVLVFGGTYIAAQMKEAKKSKGEQSVSFAPASFALKNRSFTIVIVGYNNGGYVEKTLASVFSLAYENFRVIYIDDASDDGSFDIARDCIYDSDHLTHVTLVRNEQHLGVLANIYRAVIACPDDEIIVLLNGEDWLAHEWVLQRLNAYYDDPDLWMALAQAIHYPSYDLAKMPDLKGGRNQKGVECHLKSFYASLFKKVRESDFVQGDSFLPSCIEMAYMTPMLEMAEAHFAFIPEVLCVHNGEALKEVDRERVSRCEKYIRSLEPYSPITALQELPCGD